MVKRILLSFLGLLSFLMPLKAEEIRAVWYTTNWGLDWPRGIYDEAAQKKAITDGLDKLKKAHFNLVFFQVQANGDVAWNSRYQPPMSAITGDGRKKLSYDVCRFVIDECHRRGMKCHAWVVPFVVGGAKRAAAYDHNKVRHPLKSHRKWCVLYQKNYYLDPGLPEVQNYLLDMYRELLTAYDFDGIHLDYTRYPGESFPDSKSFAAHNPRKLNRDDWRRENINGFVAKVHRMVKKINPSIVVGSAPIGTYKNTGKYKNATAFDTYQQDPIKWITGGYHDLIVPQMYWGEDKGFSAHLDTWLSGAKGARVVVGLAPYRMVENNWKADNVMKLMNTALSKKADGVCFFRAEHVIGNKPEVKKLYRYLVNKPLKKGKSK